MLLFFKLIETKRVPKHELLGKGDNGVEEVNLLSLLVLLKEWRLTLQRVE